VGVMLPREGLANRFLITVKLPLLGSSRDGVTILLVERSLGGDRFRPGLILSIAFVPQAEHPTV